MRAISRQRKISSIIGISIASVLLILSFCGRYLDYGVARSIFNFFVGSFGISFYGIMIAVIALCAMTLTGRNIVIPTKYIINFVATYITIVLLVHTYSSVYLMQLSFDSYVSTCYNYYVVPTFGGVVWGSICYALVNVMTIWGASVLLFVLLAVNMLFVVNFCYNLATHKLILDRHIINNISSERTTLDTQMVEPEVDSADIAREQAINILFDDTNTVSSSDTTTYTQVQPATMDEMLDTITRMEGNKDTQTQQQTTSTVNIDSFFGNMDNEDDFIVSSIEETLTGKRKDTVQQPDYESASADDSVAQQPISNAFDNSKDISIAEIAVQPTTEVDTQQQVLEELTDKFDNTDAVEDPVVEQYDNSNYLEDNDIDEQFSSYTGEVVNDVVAQSNQSDTFGDNSVYTITEVQHPVKGGVQVGFDIEDTAKLKEKQAAIHKYAKYDRPPTELLDDVVIMHDQDQEYRKQCADAIVAKLAVYNIDTEAVEPVVGPTVTQYRLKVLSAKTRMADFRNYADDLKSCLASADDIRIEAPIPGTSLVGIEVANNTRATVKLRTMLEHDNFNNRKARLNFAIGQDISGNYVYYDLTEMPHLLIAGTTGSGKSVVLNNLIVSMMYKYSPEYLRFIMVDPKFVELSRYNGSPHLLTSEAITDVKDALASMDYLISEMEGRFQLFRSQGVSSIAEYNMRINPSLVQKLPYIVMVVDELADLMTTNKKVFETKILRLAQKSRACGIHIVLATQRPSVDIVTGTIKSNLPARMALKVATSADSKTILGFGGAENLLGKGDMLFVNGASSNTTRVQGAYIDNDEIHRVVEYATSQNDTYFPEEVTKSIFVSQQVEEEIEAPTEDKKIVIDPLCKKALYCWLSDKGFASISSIQRKLGIGFNRAGKIFETLVNMKYVEELSASDTSGKRRVLVTLEQLDDLFPDQSID